MKNIVGVHNLSDCSNYRPRKTPGENLRYAQFK